MKAKSNIILAVLFAPLLGAAQFTGGVGRGDVQNEIENTPLGSACALQIAVSPSIPVICDGGSVTLNVSGAEEFTWSPATGLSATIGAQVIANPTETTTYTITGTTGACTATQTITVTVGEAGSIALTQTPEDFNNLCNGPITLNLPAGLDNITWSNGTQNVNSLQVNAPGTYSATAVNASGCTLQSNEIVIVETPSPNITLSPAGPLFLCDESVTISATPGLNNYSWTNSPATTASITVSTQGSFAVTASDNNGCIATSNEVIVNTGDSPEAGFTYTQNESSYEVCFTNTTINGSTYFWNFGGGNSSTQLNPCYIYPFDGEYPVALVAYNDCGNDTIFFNITVIKPSSIEEFKKFDINIYPNPVNDQLIVSFSGQGNSEQMSLTVFNLLGQELHSTSIYVQGEQNYVIDFGTYASGIYTVVIANHTNKASKRVVKN